MAKYRKKPIIVEAFRWTGGPDQTEDPEWIVEAIKSGVAYFEDMHFEDFRFRIKTLEGEMTVSPGDYVIKGVNDEIYPCKEDIFIKSYDFVSE
mgnify:CR=1 FL=1